MVLKGDTFLVPSGPEDYLHLHIVCSGEATAPDMRLLVPVSSIKHGQFFDPTCIIEAGRHGFIRKDSYVAYRHAMPRSAGKIEQNIQSGVFVAKAPLDADLLERVVNGFFISDFSAPWVLDFLR